MRNIQFIKTFLQENMVYAREKYQTKDHLTITSKTSGNDLLTEVDLTVQHRFIDAVHRHFPSDLVVAEEGAYADLPEDGDGRVWIVDPIDGTYNFVRGLFPVFGISIALAVHGELKAGGVGVPATGDIFWAQRHKGSFRNKERMRISNARLVEESCIDVDISLSKTRRVMLEKASTLIPRIGQLRCAGCASLSICQVASGDLDGYLHMALKPWDFAAGQLIVEEAGGRCTRLDGSPLKPLDGRDGLFISNGRIHDAVLAALTL